MKDVDEVAEFVAAQFAEALNHVSRAMKMLIANGIQPHADHQAIAFAWARGEVSDDTFLATARAISMLVGDDDKPVR